MGTPTRSSRTQKTPIPSGGIDLLGRPQAVVDLTVALTYIDVASTPGPIAAFADLDKVVIFRSV